MMVTENKIICPRCHAALPDDYPLEERFEGEMLECHACRGAYVIQGMDWRFTTCTDVDGLLNAYEEASTTRRELSARSNAGDAAKKKAEIALRLADAMVVERKTAY